MFLPWVIWWTFIPLSEVSLDIFLFWILSFCFSWTLCNPLSIFYIFIFCLCLSPTGSWPQYTNIFSSLKTKQFKTVVSTLKPLEPPFFFLLLSSFLSSLLERIDYIWESSHFYFLILQSTSVLFQLHLNPETFCQKLPITFMLLYLMGTFQSLFHLISQAV